MEKKMMAAFISFLLLVSLSGCATTNRKQADLEMQGLKNHVSALEAQVQGKDEEIGSLKEALNKTQEESLSAAQNFNKEKVVPRSKKHPSVKEIQAALKNAGYNPGTVDGKMGKQTRNAIRSFQKDNKLTVNGKADKKTWQLLIKYLEEKVK